MRKDSFERFYYEKVGLGEGCGCAEHVTRIRDLDALGQRLASGALQAGRAVRRDGLAPQRVSPMAAPPDAQADRKALTPVPKAVGDRIAPVAAEVLLGDLDARCRLPALVFGDVEQMLDARHRRAVVTRA